MEDWKTQLEFSRDRKRYDLYSSYCRRFSKDKSTFGSQKRNYSFRPDGIQKHEISETHKTAKLAHDAINAQPGMSPLEACLINMEKEALK